MDKTVGSVGVLPRDRCVPSRMHGVANDWVTVTLVLGESELNVQSGHLPHHKRLMWLLCAGEHELRCVRLFHPRFAQF